MLQGGNRQLRDYFEKLKVENSTVEKLYQTRASAHYREKLRERVCFLRLDNSLVDSPKAIRRNSRGDRNSTDNSKMGLKSITAMFSEGPLGMTLTALPGNGHAYVSKTIPQGIADKAGVMVGDSVISIAGRQMSNYEEIMDSIPFIQRPMIIEFSRVVDFSKIANEDSMRREVSWAPLFSGEPNISDLVDKMSVSDETPNSIVNSLTANNNGKSVFGFEPDETTAVPPTPVALDFSVTSGDGLNNDALSSLDNHRVDSIEWVYDASASYGRERSINVEFMSPPLGVTISMNSLGQAEVTKVKAGGNADALGVCVGDVCIKVELQELLVYEDVMTAIKSAVFPLSITLRRLGSRTSSPAMVPQSLSQSLSVESSHINNIVKMPANDSFNQEDRSKCIPYDHVDKIFDIEFVEHDIGMIVEESNVKYSIVKKLLEGSPAHKAGCVEGSLIIGVNGEPFVSHSHIVDKIRNATRPLSIRFRLDHEITITSLVK